MLVSRFIVYEGRFLVPVRSQVRAEQREVKRLAAAARELQKLRAWDPALKLRCTCTGDEGRGVNHTRDLFFIPEFYGRVSEPGGPSP